MTMPQNTFLSRSYYEEKRARRDIIPPVEAVLDDFKPDGVVLEDGSIEYRVHCNSSVNRSGVFFLKVVPAGASIDALRSVQKERDAAIAQLAEIMAR